MHPSAHTPSGSSVRAPHPHSTPVRRSPWLRGCLLAATLLALPHATPAAAQTHLLGMPRFEHLSRLASRLVIPVAGVRPDQLRDSYAESRSGGRVHHAIDIKAPRGTPVVAVVDGTILKLYRRGKGGNSIYHLDPDGRTRYYYAHLDRFAEGLQEGDRVQRGDVLGYVGDTGNAQPGDFHLHFSIAVLGDLARWWDGENVNPYPILSGRLSPR